MMKKILKALSLVMVLVMCFTMVFTTAVSAETTTPTLTINSAAVKDGETVTITVDAANFSTIAGAHFVVVLPEELTDVTVAESDFVAYDAEAGTVSFVKEAEWTDGVCDGIADGALVTITGKAAVGTYAVSFGETGKTTDFCTADLEEVAVEKVAGSVVVETAGPTVDTAIKFKNVLANISATLNVNIQLDRKSISSSYADYKVEVSRNSFTNTYMYSPVVDVVSKATQTSTTVYYLYEGIGMYEMSVPISLRVLCYDAKGEIVAVSETVTYNVADMVKTVYESSSADTMKNMIADMLNLGAAAQTYFTASYPDSDLAKVAMPNVGYESLGTQTFDASTLDTTNSVTFSSNYSSAKASLAVNLKKNPAAYYNISGLSALTRADVTFNVAYTNGLNNNEVSETLNGLDMTYAAKRYYHIFDDIAFYDLDKPVTATLTYAGESEPVMVATYSLESYIADNLDSETMGDILLALAKFGASARTHFIG